MKATLTDLYRGCMAGRTMYVIPFCMGPLDAEDPKYGVEITDSAYVAASMKIMTRMGTPVLDVMGDDADFVPALHSVGAPLAAGEPDVAWPCNDTKYIAHFPDTREIWSYGSGYGGNSLLGKKCYSLRIASVMARDEGWLAEHMLILKLTSPAGATHYIAAAFPSACGKTNLAMLQPTIPGWTVQTLGDDIAWMRFGEDGRLYATNPEYGFFGVAPGTDWTTNPNAMRTLDRGNSLFTNVALTDDGDVWWEGMGDPPAAPDRLAWKRLDPRAAACCPATPTPASAPRSHNARSSRRSSTTPAACPSRRSCSGAAARPPSRWSPRPVTGTTECSWARRCRRRQRRRPWARSGVVRRDPMAMLPFIGYHAGDYLRHWAEIGKHSTDPAKLPAIFQVNWFRRAADGSFLWPGYGENSRVLKWVVQRLEGDVEAEDTAIGLVPLPGGHRHRRPGSCDPMTSPTRYASTSRSGHGRSQTSRPGSAGSATSYPQRSPPNWTSCALG